MPPCGARAAYANVTLHYGAEGISDAVDSTTSDSHQRSRGAGYADFDIRALKRFSFSAGMQGRDLRQRPDGVCPYCQRQLLGRRKLKLRASVSRAFRLPNYTDLYYHDPANIGNPLLKPEQAVTYEGGADLFLNRRLRFAATLFNRRDRNDIDYVRTSLDSPWRAMNFQQLSFRGVELALQAGITSSQQVELQFTGLHGSVSAATVIDSKYRLAIRARRPSVHGKFSLPAAGWREHASAC